MNVLMLSSSHYGDDDCDYLAYADDWISEHLGKITKVLFVPYAGVILDWDAYTDKVRAALPTLRITGIHESDDPKAAMQNAQAILIGGGNTFNLLHLLYTHELIEIIKHKVEQGTPYIGWSAGSNICGLSIRTTNDMPIIEPRSFDALHFVNAQLNPHYSNYVAPNFHGETRDKRLAEFCCLNPAVPVLAIREGSGLLIRNNKLSLLGTLNGFVFASQEKIPFNNTQDLTEYL
jgi:dipeptidase E